MTDTRPIMIPGPDHPITVEAFPQPVTVRSGTTQIARTDRALQLREASYPPVFYIPLEDVDPGVLRPSEAHTYCPFKGEASYFDLLTGTNGELPGAVWYYPEPYDAVAQIKGHVAFYTDRVDVVTGEN